MSTIAKADKADHEIPVTLQNGYVVSKAPANMKVGQTVHYTSDDGEVTIEFRDNGSPFLDDKGREKLVITSKEPPIELSKDGDFTYRCFITIGWAPNNPGAGGNMIVR
jgi:hypothetical protein